MNKIYFTADLHIGHVNILRYADRKKWAEYPDITRHDEALIKEWQQRVRPEDFVYILGDFTAYQGEKIGRLMERLPGTKILIEGNHDGRIMSFRRYFAAIKDVVELSYGRERLPELPDGKKCNIVCCHYPMLTWHKRSSGAIMLHGHVHGRLDDFNRQSGERRFDVGVDGELTSKYGILKSLDDIYKAAQSVSGPHTVISLKI